MKPPAPCNAGEAPQPLVGELEMPGVEKKRGRILILLGHPRVDSFCGALAGAFTEAAEEQGLEVSRLVLADLEFDPHVRCASLHEQAFEPDLARARAAIGRADHLVFVYPVWWGTMPALLKGFLDRVLVPGFAFAERTAGQGFAGLLRGKSAHLLTTMDTPPAVVKYLLRSPGHRAFSIATLRFCGVWPVRIRMYGPVHRSTEGQRREWLSEARNEAGRLRSGRLVSSESRRARLGSWIKALRLQFYPMTWLAYTAGAALVVPLPHLLSHPVYWWGGAAVFFVEAATVFLNEVFDYESDRRNPNYGAFTGGSRTLVDGELSRPDLIGGAVIALGLSLAALAAVLLHLPSAGTAVICYLAAIVLGLGYTVPPLEFSHRGAGEAVVAFTHSLLVVQVGVLAAGGPFLGRGVFLLGLPLFFAVLPSITLSGIPDREADEAAGKRTLAVLCGVDGALAIALLGTALAVALVLGIAFATGSAVPPSLLLAGPGLHGVLLGASLVRARRTPTERRRPRIDGLMVLSLTFVLWFVLLPLLFPGEGLPWAAKP